MQVTLPVIGFSTSTRQTFAIGQPTMVVPPTHINMVNPPSSSGQPLGVKPAVNQPSWGYGYPTNQLPLVNINYQPISTGTMYSIIPYPGNTFTPWG